MEKDTVIDGLNDVPDENVEPENTIEICIDGYPVTLNDFRIDGVTITERQKCFPYEP